MLLYFLIVSYFVLLQRYKKNMIFKIRMTTKDTKKSLKTITQLRKKFDDIHLACFTRAIKQSIHNNCPGEIGFTYYI